MSIRYVGTDLADVDIDHRNFWPSLMNVSVSLNDGTRFPESINPMHENMDNLKEETGT